MSLTKSINCGGWFWPEIFGFKTQRCRSHIHAVTCWTMQNARIQITDTQCKTTPKVIYGAMITQNSNCGWLRHQLPLLLHYLQWRRNEFESGGTGPAQKWGAPVRRKAPEKFFWSCPSTFLALKVQLVVLVNAFVMVSTLWSLSCLLFFYSRCPRAPCSQRH